MFFDTAVFLQFVHDCRAVGISCPIVPGLMCINAYAGFAKMTRFCKSRVPASLAEKMEEIKHDAEKVKEFGIAYGTQMCQELIDSGLVSVLHFYTLNLEKVVYGVLDGLGWSSDGTDGALLHKVDEADAASQVAKGSAWARVGDKVKCVHGIGVVVELTEATGDAKIALDDASSSEPVVVPKGEYEKIF
jgi:hypothetical protein